MGARDILVLATVIFGIGLGFFVIHFVGTTIVDSMTSVGTINESADALVGLSGITNTVAKLDYVVLGVFFALVIGIIITGWLIGGVPIFMFIYFIITVFAVIISAFLADFWETLSQASTFGTTITAFPITNHILMNLPIYIGVIGGIGLIVMFAKPAFEK